jgi:hypothetical protein
MRIIRCWVIDQMSTALGSGVHLGYTSAVSETDCKTSAILGAAAKVITDLLTGHGFALAAPVAARFRQASHGSTGVSVTVRLADSSVAHAARGLLHDRYGSGVDVIDVS